MHLLPKTELLNGEIFYSLAEARIVVESWRRHYNRASEHPSVYAIELNKVCWFWSGPAGRLVFRWARSAIDLAASVISSARAKIQGPSLNGWRASIPPTSAASRSVLGAIFRTCAASERLSQGSTPSAAPLNTGMRVCDRNEVTRSRVQRLPWTPFCLSSGDSCSVDLPATLSDEREDLSGEVTLQGSNGVEFGMPFGYPTSNIVLGSLVGP